MAVAGWRYAASVLVVSPVRLAAIVVGWRSSPVVVAARRWSAIPTAVSWSIVVAIATVMRTLRVPLIGTHANGTARWGRWKIGLFLLASTSSVQFVAVLVFRQILRLRWQWIDFEVWVLQCVDCVDALFVVQTQ